MEYKNKIEVLEEKSENGEHLSELQAIKLQRHRTIKQDANERRKNNFIQLSFRMKRNEQSKNIIDRMDSVVNSDNKLTKADFILRAIDTELNQKDLIRRTRSKAFEDVFSMLSSETKQQFSAEFEGQTKTIKDLISFLETKKNKKPWGF